MDDSLPYEIEIAPPPGDTATSVAGPVSGYAVMVDAEAGKLIVELERRFWRKPAGGGIGQILCNASADPDGWPEFAPELIVDVVEHADVGPALPAAFSLALGRPDLVDWTAQLRRTMLEWPDSRVRSAAIAHLRDTR